MVIVSGFRWSVIIPPSVKYRLIGHTAISSVSDCGANNNAFISG
jgi:hypothetical protein